MRTPRFLQQGGSMLVDGVDLDEIINHLIDTEQKFPRGAAIIDYKRHMMLASSMPSGRRFAARWRWSASTACLLIRELR